jgi:hypothetical protein
VLDNREKFDTSLITYTPTRGHDLETQRIIWQHQTDMVTRLIDDYGSLVTNLYTFEDIYGYGVKDKTAGIGMIKLWVPITEVCVYDTLL